MIILFDNCIVGTGEASPSEWRGYKITSGVGTLGPTPRGTISRKGGVSVCLSRSLVLPLRSSLLSLGAVERLCQRLRPRAQNGYCDTYIRSRITELPLKLMTVLTVIISKSSCMSRGPLMGRVITRVALMGPVCCGQNRETR